MLDFDGVLHPEPAREDQLFVALPVLHRLLLARPATKVVVTSDWRLRYTVDELTSLLFEDASSLRSRFLGITPSLLELRYEYRGREREVEQWLKENGMPEWLALDDVAGNYSYGSKRLYLTDYRTGLALSDLHRILERIPV